MRGVIPEMDLASIYGQTFCEETADVDETELSTAWFFSTSKSCLMTYTSDILNNGNQ